MRTRPGGAQNSEAWGLFAVDVAFDDALNAYVLDVNSGSVCRAARERGCETWRETISQACALSLLAPAPAAPLYQENREEGKEGGAHDMSSSCSRHMMHTSTMHTRIHSAGADRLTARNMVPERKVRHHS